MFGGIFGSETGTVIGLCVYATIGTVGVATGGDAIALGLFGQAAIGAVVGAVATGGA